MNEQDKFEARMFIAQAHRWLALLSEAIEEGRAYEVRWHSDSGGGLAPPYTSFLRMEYDYGPPVEVSHIEEGAGT
jgi:hypothetical protein